MKKLILLMVLFLIANVAFSQEYNRNEWKFGAKKVQCKDTRARILISESEDKITFTKRKDKKECTVATGKWKDFYFNEVHTKASDVDVDHVVPLKHAHDNGGAKWTSKKKEEFANDPFNLVLTNKKYNRQKGAKTPLEWMPVDRNYACKYMKRWLAVKEKYDLIIKEQERNHFKLLKCE